MSECALAFIIYIIYIELCCSIHYHPYHYRHHYFYYYHHRQLQKHNNTKSLSEKIIIIHKRVKLPHIIQQFSRYFLPFFFLILLTITRVKTIAINCSVIISRINFVPSYSHLNVFNVWNLLSVKLKFYLKLFKI